jgi:uncharacterized protein HemY
MENKNYEINSNLKIMMIIIIIIIIIIITLKKLVFGSFNYSSHSLLPTQP